MMAPSSGVDQVQDLQSRVSKLQMVSSSTPAAQNGQMKEIDFAVANVGQESEVAIIKNFQDGDVEKASKENVTMVEIPQRKRSKSVIVP